MAIAQMNWGRMLYPLDDPRQAEFATHLARIYAQAEQAKGFIWRIPDDQVARQLRDFGHDALVSATVSVWESERDLHAYTYESEHGQFVDRASEWFEKTDGAQLVLWKVAPETHPTFAEGFERLNHLSKNGPSDYAFGWTRA